MNPTGEPDDVERRLNAVESEVAQLREQVAEASTDASAARVLAAGADRDVSEVRAELGAHTPVLTEQSRQLALVAVGIQHITDRLDYLIERDAR
jgi:chromosome segregation ATPase